MPTNALHSKLALPTLGLLLERPDHPYGLTTRLNNRYHHLRASRSSVTTLAKSLTQGGLISARAPERTGNRPPRTVYDLTEPGVAHLRQRIEEAILATPAMDADFVTALAYLGLLSRTEAIEVLDARFRRIRQEIAELGAIPTGVAEIQMIEVGYWLRMLSSEASWLEELRDRVATKHIAWIGQEPQ